jgi:4-amino-4-deoxy-L-arabinose transferase-like glycosyltransferase
LSESLMSSSIITAVKSFDPVRIVHWFSQAKRPWIWIVVIWFLFIFPAIFLRGAHFEEGTLIGLARGAFEDGNWLVPHRYGERFAERPVLLSWALAAIGSLTGAIPIWLGRMPTVLALLLGTLLIYRLVRQYASSAAALFGALCFMASPLILRKVIVAEADLFVSVALFSAFVVLWDGERRGGATLGRWIAIGAILSVAALAKGPQQLGFFFLGLGAFFLIRRRWIDLFKLGVVGLMPAAVTVAWYVSVYQTGDAAHWAQHSRVVAMPILPWLKGVAEFVSTAALDFLPGWPLLVPLAIQALKAPKSERDNLVAALILYAGVCFVVLSFWPGSRGRYAMPAILAVAAGAGLAFDAATTRWSWLARPVCMTLAVLVSFRLALNGLLIPALPDLYAASRFHGQTIAAVIATRPGTLYIATPSPPHDFLVYVPGRVRMTPFDFVASAKEPIWAFVTAEQEQALRRLRSDAAPTLHLSGRWPYQWRLIEVGRMR